MQKRKHIYVIKTLAKMIDANDSYTRGHCDKVMGYVVIICRELGLKSKEIDTIKTASMLHDIGKIGIDCKIIHKKEKLTEADWKNIKMHPEIGAKIVARAGFTDDIVHIIRYHHERFGGGGYPDPKKSGKRIPLGSRIISVADSYDAMTSDRPYRKAMSREEALEELKKCSGSQFDPKIVDAFITTSSKPGSAKPGLELVKDKI